MSVFEGFVKEAVAGRPLGQTVKGKIPRQTMYQTLRSIRETKSPETARVNLALLRGTQAVRKRLGLGFVDKNQAERVRRAGHITASAQARRELARPNLPKGAEGVLRGYLRLFEGKSPEGAL